MAALLVLLKAAFKIVAKSGFVNDGCDFEIEEETTGIHIYSPDKSKATIDGNRFGMDKPFS